MQNLIKKFFARYAARFNASLGAQPKIDVKGITGSFARYFVGANPGGVFGGKNGLMFKMMIPLGYRSYRKIGTKEMRIAKIKVTRLDAAHAMARVTWDSRYTRRKDGKPVRIVFDVTYFLQVRGGKPKIFAYVTGDEQKALKRHGLV